jgi:hypothetical protein
MNRSRLSLAVLVIALALIVPGLAQAQSGSNNANFFSPRPVLIYTVFDANSASTGGNGGTGGTGSQGIQTLVVYNNGLVVSTGSDDGSGTGTDGTTNIQNAVISQAQVNELFRQLRRAGGLRASGAPRRASTDDSPLRTITIIVDTGDNQHGLATTFSFFDTQTGNGARFLNILNNFMDQSFNGTGGTGGNGS